MMRRCRVSEEQIRKMWYIYTMEYYTAEKNNDIMKFANKWMELENVILSETQQKEKQTEIPLHVTASLSSKILKEMQGLQLLLEFRGLCSVTVSYSIWTYREFAKDTIAIQNDPRKGQASIGYQLAMVYRVAVRLGTSSSIKAKGGNPISVTLLCNDNTSLSFMHHLVESSARDIIDSRRDPITILLSEHSITPNTNDITMLTDQWISQPASEKLLFAPD
ncbi:hypothetical protein STEG23_007924 [Scotinomys teguina]